MRDTIGIARDGDRYRLHQRLTQLRSITRLFIDVLTPQALGTVIGVAIAHHRFRAVPTGKIFFVPYKSHTYFFNRIRLIAASSSQEYFRLAE